MAFADAAPRLHMDVLLTPHRSFPRRGFAALLIGLAVYNLLVMAFLLAIHAYPVPVFLGLDFAGVIIAFRVSYRGARRGQRVQVTADQVRVLQQDGARERAVWASPTAFTRVEVERAGEHDARVRLRLSGRALSVGAALGPKARADFAQALQDAIRSARAERYA